MQKSLIYFFCFFIFFNNLFSEEKNNFLMLKNNKVNVRYGPGFDYPIKFIYKKNKLPLQVIDRKENSTEKTKVSDDALIDQDNSNKDFQQTSN